MSEGGMNERIRAPESIPDEAAVGEVDYDALSVGEVIGRGGNAVVRKATLPGDPGRVVALKEPHAAGAVPEVVVERFRREAATWAGIDDHPHVVAVHGWGTDPNPWLALEFMDAGSLADRAGDVGLPEGLWTGARVAAALGHAHRAGVAHLDLTPGNVLRRSAPGDGWAVPGVADWGLARALRPETTNLEGLTPRYAAPEQFAPDRFGTPGAPTDVYGLGVVLYELLVGAPPFDGPPRALRDAVVEAAPPPASGRNPALPAAVDDVLDRALAKDPGDRHESIDAFRRGLEGLLAERTDYELEEMEPRADDGAPAGSDGAGAATDTAPSTPSEAASPYDRALALAGEGFVRLTEGYFARREAAPPLEAWRRGVTLSDARAGRAVERTVPDGDGGAERVSLGDRLLDGLAAGTDQVVLGPPGSGKSTVCKRVACEWFDRGHGPVFYRESGRGERFEAPDALARQVSDADGHALVVVEDAVRPAANAVFELLDRVQDVDDVTVLLDAREAEWREADPGADPFGTDPVARGRDALDPVYVPRPDRQEHERFVRAVEAAADRSLDVDLEQLREDVQRAAAGESDGEGTRPGALFSLLHRLTALARDPLADGDPTTLTDDVADVYDQFAEAGDRALDVGVCANVLNAAGVGVHPELLYAVVPGEALAVDDALEVLDGHVVFPREADWSDGTTAYPAVHEAWSTAFLEHLLEAEGEGDAAERFGRVLSRLLSLADDPGRREQVGGTLGGDAPYVDRVERDPTGWADETVETLYGLGRERPKLAPLFGDGVDLPEACSARAAARRPAWLGRMYLAGGYLDRAERAFERLPESEPELVAERRLGLARVAVDRGEYETARTHAEACLEIGAEPGNDRLLARAEYELGRALVGAGDYEVARDRLQAALERVEAVGDRRRTAAILDELGEAAWRLAEYESATAYLGRSLDISRELGDRRGEASTLRHLGAVAKDQNETAAAREYYERSLEINRHLGNRNATATILNNLGLVARRQGEYEAASEYHRRSLDVAGEIGNRHSEARALGNLGLVAKERGDFGAAREFSERSLAIHRDLGDPHGEALVLSNLAEVAAEQEAYGDARDYLQRGLEVYREVGDQQGEAINYGILGVTARDQGDHEAAREYLQRSIELFESIDIRRGAAESHHNLGTVCAADDDHGTAREHWRAALDTYEEVDAPQDALATLRALVENCRGQGDDEAAERWCRRAADLLEAAPEPVADQHREWVRRECSRPDGP